MSNGSDGLDIVARLQDERADDREAASGIRPYRPVPWDGRAVRAARRAAARWQPDPDAPPSSRHVEIGREGLAAARAALKD